MNLPTGGAKGIDVPCIADHITLELVEPEWPSGGRRARRATIRMPVPEATMNEDHRSSRRKDDVGFSRQVLSMQSKSISRSMKRRADLQLGCRVLAFDAAHDLATARIDRSFRDLRRMIHGDYMGGGESPVHQHRQKVADENKKRSTFSLSRFSFYDIGWWSGKWPVR